MSVSKVQEVGIVEIKDIISNMKDCYDEIDFKSGLDRIEKIIKEDELPNVKETMESLFNLFMKKGYWEGARYVAKEYL